MNRKIAVPAVLAALVSLAPASGPVASLSLADSPSVASGTKDAGTDRAGASQLVARLSARTPLADDLEELTDGIGGRVTGTAAFEKASAWALGRFREAGVDEARIETFTGAVLWIPGAESAAARVDGAALPLRAVQMPFSSNTPAGGLEAAVVDVGAGSAADFEAVGSRVSGAFVLVHTQPMRTLDDLFAEYLDMPPLLDRAKRAGAAGILWTSSRPAGLLYRHVLSLNGTRYPLPAALVEREGALRLSRRLARGHAVRVRLDLAGEYRPESPVTNVVAEVKGREGPAEVVVLGAHLDSWDLGTGTLDDGANVALVLDVARQAAALAASGVRPRRTLRFELYGGEEEGLYGSWLETRRDRARLDRLRAQVILDIGTGRITGFSLGGREDARPAVEAALRPVSAFGPFAHTADAFVGTDNFDLLLEGVPNFVANQEGPPYLPDYHAASDTFDKADLRSLRQNAIVAGGFVWELAEAATLPRRQTRAEVEELVKRTQLDAQMHLFGLLDVFEKGIRGRELSAPGGKPEPRTTAR